MKLFSLLLSAAVLANCCATESGHHTNAAAALVTPAVQTSTTNPPKVSNVKVSPGEAVPPVENKLQTEPFLIELPAFVNHSLQAEESKPLTATDLIAKNDNNDKIENQDAMDEIQSRQVQDDVQHICNYGSLLIYSDVPCKQLNKVRVGEIGETAGLVSKPAEEKEEISDKNFLEHPNTNLQSRRVIIIRPNQNKRPNLRPNKRPNQKPNKRPNLKPNKRPNQKPNKRPNQKPNKRPNQNANKRPNLNPNKRPNQNANKRPNQKPNKRPNKNNQNRPNPNVTNQNGPNRPANNGQKRPINTNNDIQNLRQQQINQRLWQQEEADDYDEEFYFHNQRNRIQPVRFIYDYDAFDYLN